MTLFDAILRPPGGRQNARGRAVSYDAVLLVETDTPARAAELVAPARTEAPATRPEERLVIAGSNVKRIGAVDHQRPGVFLFNFFSGPDATATLAAWQYTAGWFEEKTGLDNSTVILPEPQGSSPFTIVNHCRWDRLTSVLPALILRRSFRSFVLATFAASRVVPHPILYRSHHVGRRWGA